jgi:hypothetical protein
MSKHVNVIIRGSLQLLWIFFFIIFLLSFVRPDLVTESETLSDNTSYFRNTFF